MNKEENTFDYYKAPPQKVFDEIKENSIKIWETYDDDFWYDTKSIKKIKDLENIRDNAWYIVAMFDRYNQEKLLNLVSPETADLIRKAIEY